MMKKSWCHERIAEGLEYINSIAVDNNSNTIYFTSQRGLWKIDSNSSTPQKLDKESKTSDLCGIALKESQLFVCDRGKHQILQFNTHKCEWKRLVGGRKGYIDGSFFWARLNHPWGITLDQRKFTYYWLSFPQAY